MQNVLYTEQYIKEIYMSDTLKEIEKKALELPEKERALLAEHLITSLEKTYDPDVESAWVEESERRYQAYKSGSIQGIPAEEVFRKARKTIK